MQSSTIGTIEPTTIFMQQQTASEGVGSDVMDQQDFLNLLVTQLQNQDPLDPEDSADFMTQTTMFSQLDEMISMNETMSSMLELYQIEADNMNTLLNGSNFIGKEIEFITNTITLGDAVSNFSFYLGEEPASGQINVYNESGELVTMVTDVDLTSGQNIIPWDGSGIGGTQMTEGTYWYEVLAYDSSGAQISVDAFATGIVQSVSQVNGQLYFDIGEGVVSSEYVYTVREATEDTTTDGDTSDGDTSDSDTTTDEDTTT